MKSDGRASTEVSVKTTCEYEQYRWHQIGAYVAIIKRILLLEIKRSGKVEGERRNGQK